jgi:hypothetical protein
MVPEIDQHVLRLQKYHQEGVTTPFLKILDLRGGKKCIYKPNITPSEGNLPERKKGVGFFFFRLRKI